METLRTFFGDFFARGTTDRRRRRGGHVGQKKRKRPTMDQKKSVARKLHPFWLGECCTATASSRAWCGAVSIKTVPSCPTNAQRHLSDLNE